MPLPIIQIPFLNVHTTPLDVLLYAVGWRMQQLARTNPQFKALLPAKPITIQLRTNEGDGRYYVMSNDKVAQHEGMAANADLTLQFRDRKTALNTLIRGDGNAIMSAIQLGLIKVDGNPELIKWLLQIIPHLKLNEVKSLALRYLQKAQGLMPK